MSDQLTGDEIEQLLKGTTVAAEPEPTDPELLAELLGPPTPAVSERPVEPETTRAAPGGAATPTSRGTDGADGLAWEAALHLVPGYEGLCTRYPPVTERQHPRFGRVIVLAYLEDRVRRVRRNSKIGQYMFFDYPELELIEPDTRSLNCRVSIKVIKYDVGLRIRFWENSSAGDVPGKSGAILVTEPGLRLERRGRP